VQLLAGGFIYHLDSNFLFFMQRTWFVPLQLVFIIYYGLAIISFLGHIASIHHKNEVEYPGLFRRGHRDPWSHFGGGPFFPRSSGYDRNHHLCSYHSVGFVSGLQTSSISQI